MTIVTPSASIRSLKIFTTRRLVFVSSSPVGSSAKSTLGRCAMARAMATRCCSPPDSSCGMWPARLSSPTSRRHSMARALKLPRTRASRSANSTFSRAFIIGISATDWNTKPILLRRSRVRSSSDMRATSCPSNSTSPAVGRSSALKMFRSVVLPEPLRPFRMVRAPAGMSASMPLSAQNLPPLTGKARVTPRARSISLESVMCVPSRQSSPSLSACAIFMRRMIVNRIAMHAISITATITSRRNVSETSTDVRSGR